MVLAITSSGAGPGTKHWLEERLLHITNPLRQVMGYRGRLCGIACVCVEGKGSGDVGMGN